MLSELLYADDLALMSETIELLGNELIEWKEVHESHESVKVNLGKTKVMISGGITKDRFSKSKANPSWDNLT